MGIVKEILSSKKIDKVSTICSNQLSVELSEDFHIHYRNTRMEFDKKEWSDFCSTILSAYFKWNILFRPKIGDIDNSGKQIFLSYNKISEEPGKYNKAVNPNEIRIELQQWADYIHIHYKWFRLEFTIDEFKDFADTISDAINTLENNYDLDTIPKREGKFHQPCPKGRVTTSTNNDFWINRMEDFQIDDAHKTIYLNNKDSDRNKKELIILKNNFISNFIYKIIYRFPRIGKILGIAIR